MKKADLEKRLGQKIVGRMRQEPHSDRYGAASGAVADKREQRERDKAAGLVPFAVKLPQALVARLQSLAVERGVTLNELTGELLAAVAQPQSAAASTPKKKPDAKPTASQAKPPPDARPKTPATKPKPAKPVGRK